MIGQIDKLTFSTIYILKQLSRRLLYDFSCLGHHKEILRKSKLCLTDFSFSFLAFFFLVIFV